MTLPTMCLLTKNPMYKGKKCAQEQIIQMTDCEAMTVMRAKNNTQVDRVTHFLVRLKGIYYAL